MFCKSWSWVPQNHSEHPSVLDKAQPVQLRPTLWEFVLIKKKKKKKKNHSLLSDPLLTRDMPVSHRVTWVLPSLPVLHPLPPLQPEWLRLPLLSALTGQEHVGGGIFLGLKFRKCLL